MAKIRVYQFDYFSRADGKVLRSTDFATESAIVEIGAVLVAETARDVEESQIGRAGYLITEKARR